MGGTALWMSGSFDLSKCRATTPQRGLRRFFAKRRVPEWKAEGAGQSIEIFPAKLDRTVLDSLRKFLSREFAKPSDSSNSVLDYLDFAFLLRIRGYRETSGAEPQWTVELLFSGCGGMAQVSSEVAYHWFCNWLHHSDESVSVARRKWIRGRPTGRNIRRLCVSADVGFRLRVFHGNMRDFGHRGRSIRWAVPSRRRVV